MTSKTKRSKHFREARRFVDHFLYGDEYGPRNVLEATLTGRGGFIFRGQRDPTWPLLPSAHRSTTDWSQCTPQGPFRLFLKNASTQPAQMINFAIGTHLHAELRSVLLFLEAADRMGIATPLNYDEFVAGHDKKLQPIMRAASLRRDPNALLRSWNLTQV